MAVDVAIIGAGFSGSLLAWILAKQGRSVALIDRQSHPRFAIGESSTPLADLTLRRLGERYGIRELIAMSTYGDWKASQPQVTCGCKRGFSYYVHRLDEPFTDDAHHSRSLLVAASASDERADTQWYREEVDEFFFRRALSAGVEDLTGHTVTQLEATNGAHQLGIRQESSVKRIRCRWLIDASGSAAALAQLMGVAKLPLRTKTFSSFAHFEGVGSWRSALIECGLDLSGDPFDTDAAAQHHLIDDAWVWMLRFDNGVTSVGLTSTKPRPLRLDRYPSLARLFAAARRVAPAAEVNAKRPLQRLFDPCLGDRALLLPTAALTIDPLHSTGIAHGLAGVGRVAAILLEDDERRQRTGIEAYRKNLLVEARFLDELVSTAYATMHDFERFAVACMVYFASAIACEERMLAGDEVGALWNVDRAEFAAAARESCRLVTSQLATDRVTDQVRRLLAPWNTAGLISPDVANRYAYTATK